MAETFQFGLPLVAAAQAQKHVTVNEALARLDAVAQLRVIASDLAVPPPSPQDGEAYLVPPAAVAEWVGHAGELALWANGGWAFITPRIGWRLWDASAAIWQMYDGDNWVRGATAISPNGGATVSRVINIAFTISGGGTSTVPAAIPAFAQVIGITGRITSAFTGGSATWRIGVPGSNNRYGSGLGKGLNSYLLGISGAPVSYYEATDLLITGEGGDISGGEIALAIHITELVPPRAV